MNRFKWIVCALLLQQGVSAQRREQFPDVLDLRYTVKDTGNVTASFFSDNGAWHAYALPENGQDAGFTGPLLMDMKGEWLSDRIARLGIYEHDNRITWQETTAHYYPGMLRLTCKGEGLVMTQELIFSGNREALLYTKLTNTTGRERKIRVQYDGNIALQRGALTTGENSIRVAITGTEQVFTIRYLSAEPWSIRTTPHHYEATRSIVISANDTWKGTQLQAYHLEPHTTPDTSDADFGAAMRANEERWNGYMKTLFSRMPFAVSDKMRSRLAVKSMITLLTNWRSAARSIHHDGLFPSASYQGFYGIWSWDSWKQAVGLTYIDPALAKSNIQALFDWQLPDGMIPDCIYTDSTENNLRDTKPPLAAWAVWKVFEASHDTAFLRSMDEPLRRYHEWWYTARDHDRNGLCEYGSADGTRIAAAWESGMDNAVRFDHATMLDNGNGAWSLNQESVDLNSYLFKEKRILAQIAEVLEDRARAKWLQQEADQLKALINAAFYDKASGFYYDRHLSGALIRIKGAEGWIPMWAGITGQEQAKSLIKHLQDTAVFNTLVPLPVLDASEKAFDPRKGYWRGPVWMDQFEFAISGMDSSGYHQQATALTKKLWQHAAGMNDNKPLHENYHPRSGQGLNAPNFSWTAAHVLMLLAAKH
ncbi:MAG TPA: trehalase family glycosidase [Chitinophaga sp.]|uniref:MGH1-like glycoside hydrolase domain-containing protein n=1 Tax=Chitinophaga sp. TaxID=1869181 RepID=UPI002CC43ACD|nr:trehalase family glycosidase [Chitinophaga sp.]HVI48399.1 trehalase family glycosidase [Chitinophaga sp.]